MEPSDDLVITIWGALESQNVDVGRGPVSLPYRKELKSEKLSDLSVPAVAALEFRPPKFPPTSPVA